MIFRAQFICLFLTLLPAILPACDCDRSRGFCEALPDATKSDRAIFVGKVAEFHPKSREDLNNIEDARIRAVKERARSQATTNSNRSIATEGPVRFDQKRRARFEVVENFTGAEAPDFTLYTALDGVSCGFDFVEGETYLVEAYRRSGSDTWEVVSCSRTSLIGKAAENLRVLHAWKAGQRLPGHITGGVFDRSKPAATSFQVRLLGGKQILESTTDKDGQFEFSGLDAGVYQVQVVQPEALSRPADLSHAWCASVFIPLGP